MPTLTAARSVSVVSFGKLPFKRQKSFFSSREWASLAGRARPGEGLAARLAAKAGFIHLLKSLGWSGALPARGIEVLNLRDGQPYFRLGDSASRTFLRQRRVRAAVSLAHSRTWGLAAVLFRFS